MTISSLNYQTEVLKMNPLDMIEQIVADHEWPFDRQGMTN